MKSVLKKNLFIPLQLKIKNMSVVSILRGTGVAIITPFNAQQAVDYAALSTLIDHVINGGVQYIVTLGTTGETPVLTTAEKKEIIHFTQKYIANRVPMIVGIGGNDTNAVVHELQTYPLHGAAAILSASPSYNKPSQEGIFQHYKAIAAASPKPIILYNVPGRTGRNMTAPTTLRIANELPNIIGIKEASGDMQQCIEILKDRPNNFAVVSGDDALALPQIACGMEGVISVAANVFPTTFCNMVQHALASNFVDARMLNNSLLEAYNLMFAENNPAGAKAFLHELGIMENVLRLPSVPLSAELHQAIKKYLSLQTVS